MDEASIAVCGFVVTGGEATRVLQLIEAALNAVSQRIDVVVDDDRVLARASAGDDGGAFVLREQSADAIGIVALVGDQDFRRHLRVDDEIEALVVRDFAAGDFRGDRETLRVGAEVDFGREATFRTAKTLSLSPPFAPAAW